MLRVRAIVAQHVARQDDARTNQFLYAASRDDVTTVRQMLQQGFGPDSADYDNRTALMLACVQGHQVGPSKPWASLLSWHDSARCSCSDCRPCSSGVF